jgi:ribosome-binding ATPase YchF (GTP1/OBG family)
LHTPRVCKRSKNARIIPVSARIEEEIALLDDNEKAYNLKSILGFNESGLDRLVSASYSLLGLISIFLPRSPARGCAWTD